MQRLINWKTSCVCFNSLFCYAIGTPAAGHVRQRWKRRGGSTIFQIVQQTASTHSFLHLKIPERGNLPAAHRKADFFTHQRKGAHRQWPKDSTLKDAGKAAKPKLQLQSWPEDHFRYAREHGKRLHSGLRDARWVRSFEKVAITGPHGGDELG